MPFIVRKNPNGRQAAFKLYFQKESGGKRKYTYIPPNEFVHYGFDTKLTYEEAVALRTLLNKQSAVKVRAERRSAISKQVAEKDAALAAFVSDEEGFKEYVMRTQRSANFSSSKFQSHWRATKVMLAELKISPPDFEESRRVFYRYFAEKKFAPSYAVKLLRCLNLYGRFYAKKFKTHVERVPQPSGYDLADVADAYFEKRPTGGASSPLRPEHLPRLAAELSPEQYNWMVISFWCGLRPWEVNSLHKAGTYRWEKKEGVDILCVYQSKLKRLAREKRWKKIPMVEPEQAAIKELIEGKQFRKPLIKTIQRILDETFTCYAGRKGFEPLMKSRGHDFVNVSRWLGHQDLNRTFRDYGDDEVSFKKKAG